MTTAGADQLAVFAALAAERVTLVTPNRRLAAWYKQAFDRTQIDAGRIAWPSADILPWTTFVERSWRSMALRVDGGAPLHLLDAPQAQLLWEQAIRKSDTATLGLMNVREAAARAAAAWTLARAWHLLPAMQKIVLHEDAAAFVGWSKSFQDQCRERHAVDSATLPDLLARLIAASADAADALPEKLLMAGFDITTPQQHHLLRVLRDAGVAIDSVPSPAIDGACVRLEFADEQQELRGCAAWARQRLEARPAMRIGIVVPDLQRNRARIARELTDSLMPGTRSRIDGVDEASAPLFNISLGVPLADYALVRDALAMLDFSRDRPLPYLAVSALLRSPFIAGAETEAAARALLDARFRESSPGELTLSAVRGKLAKSPVNCAQLIATLDAVQQCVGASHDGRRNRTGSPAPGTPPECSQYFGRVLSAWGFPGERSLGSIDFQIVEKLRDAMSTLAALQAIQPRMRVDEALNQLRRIAGDLLFQPEADTAIPAPIQVLGILESAGQQFDALWVTGLADNTWPLAARPNPFIPASLQRGAGVPESSAAESLKLDRRITEGWRRSANEVVFSHALVEGASGNNEQARAASALIRDIAPMSIESLLNAQLPPSYVETLCASASIEPIPDLPLALLPSPTRIRGGANVIRDQAACAFRGFARHRLAARALEVPQPGLDAAERGTLLHQVLNLVWQTLVDHVSLLAASEAELQQIVEQAAERAISEAHEKGVASLTGRFARIEQARLYRLVLEWLAYERDRTPFTVIERESSRDVQLAGLAMSLRLDRMDRLGDGTHALIDYKTGVAKLASWLGERPDEPQLPLYFCTAQEEISALAFARVKRGERGKVFGFEGVSAIEGLLPDVGPIEAKANLRNKGYVSWDVLTTEWEGSLQKLADDFSRGLAEVDPKHGGLTCAQCDLQPLCRVAEVSGYAALAIDEGSIEATDE
ncbi:MAG: PD-(D/E)XK nuclease family protein [Betaproteobacteria bacterium]|nr:PD-(D/E)XK nuclease family protein [Betaproteobacteria bacterium]